MRVQNGASSKNVASLMLDMTHGTCDTGATELHNANAKHDAQCTMHLQLRSAHYQAGFLWNVLRYFKLLRIYKVQSLIKNPNPRAPAGAAKSKSQATGA
jgi:hypothetical protein